MTPSQVTQMENQIFDNFLMALDINPEDVDINYGMASYADGDVFKGHCPVYFGMYHGEMGLLIGVENRQFKASSLFIPCDVSEEEVKHGKRTVKEWIYTLNGAPLKLEERLDNEGKSSGKFYLSINHQIDSDEFNFSFPFLVDKFQGEKSPEEIKKVFKSGAFSTILKDLGMSTRIWIAANKAFIPSFRDKSFPEKGILLLVNEGVIKVTPAGSHPNIKTDIVQSQWKIISTSHPELLIQYFGSDKLQQIDSLGNCNYIQFTQASQNNEGYTWLVSKGVREYNDFALIHIVSPSHMKLEHTPVNTLTNLVVRMKAKMGAYPHMAKLEWVQKPGYAGGIGGEENESFTPPPSATRLDVDDFFKEGVGKSVIGDDDLFQDYPKSLRGF